MQLGADIDGESYLDLSGKAVSISDDGLIVAIGAVDNDGTSSDISNNQGHVRVYKYNNTNWNQLGTDIDGEVQQNHFGQALSLSGDGSTLAVGVPKHDVNETLFDNSGLVRLYKYDGFQWNQLGNDIEGEGLGDANGFSVDLSHNGSVVAIGAPDNDFNGNDAGYTRIFQWEGTQWAQRGDDINGEASQDKSGYSVSLSRDGDCIAVGAVFNDGNGENSGHVRVYEWKSTYWQQVGSDIDGKSGNNESGYSVSISADGTIVVIGAPKVSQQRGHVRVFKFDGSASWNQLGTDIVGESFNDNFGLAVSISDDGIRLAVGSPFSHGNVASATGRVQVYEWDNVKWNKLGSDINGLIAGDTFGSAVSLSGNGMKVAIGGPLHENVADGGSLLVGHVRVFEIKSIAVLCPGDSHEPSRAPSHHPSMQPTDCEDDPTYVSPVIPSLGCELHRANNCDCYTFQSVMSYEELEDLFMRCPKTCGVTCGTGYEDPGSPSVSSSPTVLPSITKLPSSAPSHRITILPSSLPTSAPSQYPNMTPSQNPSLTPTNVPSLVPFSAPSRVPSSKPSNGPSVAPSASPTGLPTSSPSQDPSQGPTSNPSEQPSANPSKSPTSVPTSPPSDDPSSKPSNGPSVAPSASPTGLPTSSPSQGPSLKPSGIPSMSPSLTLSVSPTLSLAPSSAPTQIPSISLSPTNNPSLIPTAQPSDCPSQPQPEECLGFVCVSMENTNIAIFGMGYSRSSSERGYVHGPIDGNTKTEFSDAVTYGSTHESSGEGVPHWWEVNLRGVFNIAQVKIFACDNLACHPEGRKLDQVQVDIFDGPVVVFSSHFFSDHGPVFDLVLPFEVRGQIVRITKMSPGKVLSLSEVQVFGY